MPQMAQVVSTKYDGSLRDSYEAELLEKVGGLVRLSVPAGTPVLSGKSGQWFDAPDGGMDMYFDDRWYNVYHHGSSAPYLWYCNIAMPATFDGSTLRWVDLDIDIRCHLDGSLRVLDEDEFEHNRVEMAYPQDVVERALAARDEVLELASKGLFPFDHDAQIRSLS